MNTTLSKFFYLHKGLILLDGNGNWLHSQCLDMKFAAWQSDYLYIGTFQAEPVYLHILEDNSQHQLTGIQPKALLSSLSKKDFSLAGRALQLSYWLKDHQFCGRCGTKTRMNKADYHLACLRCEHRSYPRVSPSVIVAVTGPEGILLAHNVSFAENRYSVIAGFVEAGESAEDAGHREVKEEVNLKIKNLRYISSQSWSFPHSLMLGFVAEYESGEIQVDGLEIDSAGWFNRNNLPDLPSSFSISRELIELGLNTCA